MNPWNQLRESLLAGGLFILIPVLSFQEEGKAPAANAGAAYLKDFDTYYIFFEKNR